MKLSIFEHIVLEKNINRNQKKKLEHLSNLIKLSLADKVISHREQEFLDSYAKDLGLSKDEYYDVLLNPNKYQFNIEINENERIERLYYMVKLTFSDEQILSDEIILLEKMAITLDFPEERIEKLIKKAIYLVINNYKLEKFSKKIKKFLDK